MSLFYFSSGINGYLYIIKNNEDMKQITLVEYNNISNDFKSIWTTERWDLPNWENDRLKYIGKKTMMVWDNGTTVLIEGIHFEII